MIDFPSLSAEDAHRLNDFISYNWGIDVLFAQDEGTLGQLVQAFAPARDRLAQYELCVQVIVGMPALASDPLRHTLTPLQSYIVRQWAREWTLLSSDPRSLMPVAQEVIDLGTQLLAALGPIRRSDEIGREAAGNSRRWRIPD